ncbi:MAG TPA: HupE/UreJ family protein [Kofleriaceae bacterium]|nr:HupE/UreJ family protein [Kofleriaceae bacterium]
MIGRRAGGRLTAIAAGVLGLVALVAGARPASAHPLDIGYLRIEASGTSVAVTLDIHVNAAAHLVGIDPARMDATQVASHAAALADATLRRAPLVTSAGRCAWAAASVAGLTDRTVSFTSRAECPTAPRSIEWAFPFVAEARVSPTFQVLVKAQLAGEDHVAIVDKLHPALALASRSPLGFGAVVWAGVERAGAAPSAWHGPAGWMLPDGIDLILFLLALMLAGGSLTRILGIVGGFALGHSLTLALSALHVVRPPALLIEPLIALAIALVAAEAVLGKLDGHRWIAATCLGLIFGFGLAGALNQMDLAAGGTGTALLGYNLGLELGQLTIVLITAPLILHLQRHRRYHWITRGLAGLIFIAGLFAFFQRL